MLPCYHTAYQSGPSFVIKSKISETSQHRLLKALQRTGFSGLELPGDLHPVLGTIDYIPYIICRYLPYFYTDTKLHSLATEAYV